MEKKKVDTKKVLLIGAGVAGAAVLGYFGYQYYQNNMKKPDEDDDTASFSVPTSSAKATPPPSFTKTKPSDEFPLKKGSRGARVKMLQDSLIAKHGASILPKYGADGDFGSELDSALKKLNLPATIDETTFNVIAKAPSVSPMELAKALYKDAVGKNLVGVIASLKKMRSKEDYTAVSNEFKKYPLRGVRQTLVNGILGSFPDESSKQQVRLEFSRMGLKYDGTKWSLSGLEGFKVMTTRQTTVWRTSREGAKVPASMILGSELGTKNGYTLFENEGRRFLVKTADIKYL